MDIKTTMKSAKETLFSKASAVKDSPKKFGAIFIILALLGSVSGVGLKGYVIGIVDGQVDDRMSYYLNIVSAGAQIIPVDNFDFKGYYNISNVASILNTGTINGTGWELDADGDTTVKTLSIAAVEVINADPDLVGIVDATISGTFTDGTYSVAAGVMTGIASLDGAGTIDLEDNLDGTGFTVTAGTFDDGTASMSGGTITDGTASLTTGAWTGVTGITATGTTGVAVLTTSGAATLGDGGDAVTFNAGTADLDMNADGYSWDLDTNADEGIDITRTLAATGSAPIVAITQAHATDDEDNVKLVNVGLGTHLRIQNAASGSTNQVRLVDGAAATTASTGIFYRNLAAASTSDPMVTITNANAGDDQETLLIDDNRDGTGGAPITTDNPSVRIDSENPESAGLFITAPIDGTGADYKDDAVIVVESEGIGTGIYAFRNTAATLPLVRILDNHADVSGNTLTVVSNADVDAAAPVVSIETTDVAHDEPVLKVHQEGTGEIATFERDHAGTNLAGVIINIDHIDDTGSALYIKSDADADAGAPVVKIETTSAAHDWSALDIVHVGLPASGLQITVPTATAGGHITLVPIADSSNVATEGMMVADDDGIVYYRSNGGLAAMNAATDFGEPLTSEETYDNYPEGTLMYLSSDGKVDATNQEYQKAIGVISEKPGRARFLQDRSERTNPENGLTWNETNINTVVVGLIGLVDCRVIGPVNVNDAIVASGVPGLGMADANDSPAKLIVARARSTFTGEGEGVVSCMVGVN